jgi:hypothetical protein
VPPPPPAFPFISTPTWDHLGIWIAALLTLAVYSFLYSDNPLFRLAEHLFVGVSAAYSTVIFFHGPVKDHLIYPAVRLAYECLALVHLQAFAMSKPVANVTVDFRLWLLPIPLILGFMIFGRFFRGWEWLSRWPIAFMVGFGAGSVIPVTVQANILAQAQGTIDPFLPKPGVTLGAPEQLGNWILALAVLTTLSYFYFSAPHRGWLGRSSRVGVWFLMIAFGAGFGNTVMARVALLIGRMQFLIHDWAPLWWPGLGPPGR